MTQQAAICRCPEPDQSSPRIQSLLIFILILSELVTCLHILHQTPECTFTLLTCYMPHPSIFLKFILPYLPQCTRRAPPHRKYVTCDIKTHSKFGRFRICWLPWAKQIPSLTLQVCPISVLFHLTTDGNNCRCYWHSVAVQFTPQEYILLTPGPRARTHSQPKLCRNYIFKSSRVTSYTRLWL